MRDAVATGVEDDAYFEDLEGDCALVVGLTYYV